VHPLENFSGQASGASALHGNKYSNTSFNHIFIFTLTKEVYSSSETSKTFRIGHCVKTQKIVKHVLV
jgi:hypothetical protein